MCIYRRILGVFLVTLKYMIICLVYSFLFLNEVNLLLLESLVKGGYEEKDDVKFLRKNLDFGSKSE